MSVPTLPHPGASAAPVGASSRALATLAAIVAALFALGAIEYALALAAGRVPLLVQALAGLTSADFAFGPRATTVYMVQHYTAALPRLGSHMALGGLALGLGVLQLVPSLRRRHPRWHRASGLVVWLATLASMVGAIGFLVYIPMREGSSGPAFHLGLWALALLTLALLSQAVLAVRARDYRSHMVWMACVFACLATAPMLRVNWTLWGRFSQMDQETANLATGTLVLLQTLALMALWLARVGDRDLPAREPHTEASAWPMAVVTALVAGSAAVVLHEVAAALVGVDGLARWRTQPADHMPAVGAAVWALGSLLTLAGFGRGWRSALAGQAPSPGLTAAGALAGIGAIVIGLTHATDTLARQATATFWVGYGCLALVLLAAALRVRPTSGGRNACALFWLCLQWMPSQLPGFLLLGWALGLQFDEAMAQALVNGVGGVAVAGLATGYGARLHGLNSARQPTLKESRP